MYKLNISKIKNINFYDKEISSDYVKKFDDILWYNYSEKLFGEETITTNNYITDKPFNYSKEQNIFNNLDKYIYYNKISKYFYVYNEILNYFKILKNNSINLIISSSFLDDSLSVLEAIKYNNINNKYKNTNYINTIISYNQFKSSDDIKKQGNIRLKYELLKKNIKKLTYINKIVSTKLLKSKIKYNNIISNIHNYKDITPNFYEIDNIGLIYYVLLYSVINLKKDGNVIIRTSINKKITCDIILIFSKYFKSYNIYNSDILDKVKYNPYFICFKNFKECNDIESLTKLLKELLKYNKGFNNFNIYSKKIRYRFKINRPILLNNQFNYPDSLLDKKITSDIYKPFLEFNTNIYKNKIDYINNLINNFSKKKIISNDDIYKIILYCKKNNLKLNKSISNKKIIINIIKNNIDNLYNSCIIKLKSNETDNIIIKSNNYNLLLYSLYSNLNNEIKLMYLNNNFKKSNLFYPNYMEKELIKYINKKYELNIYNKSYTNWINIYEILKTYNFNINNTIHLCSNFKETKKVIEYLLKRKQTNNKIINNSNKIINNSKNKYNLYIGNCCNTINIQNINFSYYLGNNIINRLKFNYKNDINIITLYYKEGDIFFQSKKISKLLKYDLENDFLNHNNDEHYLELHKNKNISIFHSHIKVKKEKEYDFINDLFKIFKIDMSHLDNIKKAKKIFTDDYDKQIIKFKGDTYAENYFEVYEENMENINKFKFKESYYKNITKLNNLELGGNAIIKFSLPLLYKYELDLIYKLYINFKNIEFYKPTLNSYLNEYYIICKNFKKKDMKKVKKIKKKLNKKNILDYDQKFIQKINYSFKEIYKLYTKTINSLNILLQYRENTNKIDNIKNIILNKNKEWCEKYII